MATKLIQAKGLAEPLSAVEVPTCGAALAVALMPVMLFYHDSPLQMRQQLNRIVTAWGGTTEAQIEVVAVAQVMAHILRQPFQLSTSQQPDPTLTALVSSLQRESSAASAPLVPLLEQVQTAIAQQSDLATTVSALRRLRLGTSPTAIAQAVYCFLSTPDDLELVVRRASQITGSPAVVGAIAGAIAGAYSGIAGMPLTSSLLKAQLGSRLNSTPYLESEQVDLRHLAASLFAVWSGATEPSPLLSAAIAAPGVIRPR
jgi:ADP-ribosylglycohydrolase